MIISNRLKTHGYKIFTLFTLFIVIVNFKYDVIVINKTLSIALLLIYYLICSMGIYSFYKTDRSSNLILFITVVLSLGFFFNVPLLIPFILLLGLVASDKYNLLSKVVVILASLLFFIAISLTMFFSDYSSTKVVEVKSSTNNVYNYVKIYHDEGAFGCSFSVHLEKEIFGTVKVRKRLKLMRSDVNVEWITDRKLLVNGEYIDVRMFP